MQTPESLSLSAACLWSYVFRDPETHPHLTLRMHVGLQQSGIFLSSWNYSWVLEKNFRRKKFWLSPPVYLPRSSNTDLATAPHSSPTKRTKDQPSSRKYHTSNSWLSLKGAPKDNLWKNSPEFHFTPLHIWYASPPPKWWCPWKGFIPDHPFRDQGSVICPSHLLRWWQN